MALSNETRLIQAIEDGDHTAVESLLALGADPNTRKRVTLTCSVKAGRRSLGVVRVRKNMLRMDDYRERFEDVFVGETDTVFGESALALAIITRRVAIVHTLLERGADPNLRIEWRNSDSGLVWTKERWDTQRWARTFSAENALILALGRGVKVFDCDGRPSAFSHLAETGKIRVNKPGGHVMLRSPASFRDAYEEATLQPRPDIAGMLIQYGAVVTIDAMVAARKMNVEPLIELMERHSLGQSLSPANGTGSGSSYTYSYSGVRSPSPNTKSPPNIPTGRGLIRSRSISEVHSERFSGTESLSDTPQSAYPALATLQHHSGPRHSMPPETSGIPDLPTGGLQAPATYPSPPMQTRSFSPATAQSFSRSPARTGSSPIRGSPSTGAGARTSFPPVRPPAHHISDETRFLVRPQSMAGSASDDRGSDTSVPSPMPPPMPMPMPMHTRGRTRSVPSEVTLITTSPSPVRQRRTHSQSPGPPTPSGSGSGGGSHIFTGDLFAPAASRTREVDELRKDNANLRALNESFATSLDELERASIVFARENSALKTRLESAERELAAMRQQLVAAVAIGATAVAGAGGVGAGGERRPPSPPRPKDVKKVMHVVEPYTPREPDEIVLHVGQQVFCNWEFEDGWGSGLNTDTGFSGFFPLICVSPTRRSPAPTTTMPGHSFTSQPPASADAPDGSSQSQKTVSPRTSSSLNRIMAPLSSQLYGYCSSSEYESSQFSLPPISGNMLANIVSAIARSQSASSGGGGMAGIAASHMGSVSVSGATMLSPGLPPSPTSLNVESVTLSVDGVTASATGA
ncbi:hypothetical protein M427DRAFT_158643 [Gonapodya prolifera JEL478]|uniref:Uncharacterized protein n=1 Tax=Gonapodya prolifera (strain JEL478) TaxID=1344416 RepID=A0A139A2R0_GONPJ|nr:hypothetical protein M427DRAFT_158643 [Gonapodya prolifera JEL478]|eukprot:KXS10938.1 hypothetical protein M427DRAFT_158643 [Gonapodya prolifera JEL478]